MFGNAKHLIKFLVLLTIALAVISGFACQTNPESNTPTNFDDQTQYKDQNVTSSEIFSTPTNDNAPIARSIHGNPTTSMGLPVSAIYLPPQSIQDLVNRVDAVITGTISAIGNTASEVPYNHSQETNPLTQSGHPPPTITVTHYTITIDQILLNDHNIAANPILRLGGSHSESLPQVGETFLFALDVNPDRKSYGIIENWNLIPLDGGPIQNFDGTEPGYPGVTNEQSLKSAIQKAVTTRSPSQPSDWPKRSFIPDENADN